ncbi:MULTISPECIES: hypothetical protein [Paenibacillus]|uniref:Uncharacterized protein n=1 Tax=Paenibacillus urinalis TaxID=521520 RepID=A0ABY7XH63_9BACL|nr:MULTISPECIES: hypothetical protein [Paenibacillus]WDI05181.1 hypothetical protein PUW25_25570 [Paenibacillus urinalis]
MEIRNGNPIIGQRVDVYVNLNKKGVFSILDRQPKSPTYNKVLAYAERVTIRSARSRIIQSKYDSIQEKKQRAVCAVFSGTLVAIDSDKSADLNVQVRYNPYRSREFHTLDGSVIDQAELIHFEDQCGWISTANQNDSMLLF